MNEDDEFGCIQMKTMPWLIILSMSGCVHPNGADRGNALSREDVRNGRQIVLRHWTRGTESDTTSTSHCVFDKDGNCFCDLTTHGEWRHPGAGNPFVLNAIPPDLLSKKTIQLPAETFREVQQLLLESKVLSGHLDQRSGASLSIECDGRKFISFGEIPKECHEIMAFMNGLPDRGKVISPAPMTPVSPAVPMDTYYEFLKRRP